jgi:hypothetical protein
MSETHKERSDQSFFESSKPAENYFERLVNRLDNDRTGSDQNRKERDDDDSEKSAAGEDEQKKLIESQIEENVEEERPSITQLRDSDQRKESEKIERKIRRYASSDIASESEIPVQHRPSHEDYEYEKQLYCDESKAKAKSEKPQKPADPNDTIQALQTRREDRGAPFVDFKDPRNLRRQSCQDTMKKLSLPEHICDLLEEGSDRSSARELEIEQLIGYLTKYDTAIKQILSDDDRKKIDLLFHLAKETQDLCKEASETLRKDLLKYYQIGKHKWKHVIVEINKQQAAKVDDERSKSDKNMN